MSGLTACPACDEMQRIPDNLGDHQQVVCGCCATVLVHPQYLRPESFLALSITGLMLFVFANAYPLLKLTALGITNEGTLFSTGIALLQADQPFLGILVFLTTIFFPFLSLLGYFVIYGMLIFDRMSARASHWFKMLVKIKTWGMLEVFLLALVVSMVKLGDLADMVMGVSAYAFAALVVLLFFMSLAFDPQLIWREIRVKRGIDARD